MQKLMVTSFIDVDDETMEKVIDKAAHEMTDRCMQMWHPIVDSNGYIDLPDDADYYLVTAEDDLGKRRMMITYFSPADISTGEPAIWGNYTKVGRWKNLAWMFLPPIWEEDDE